MPSSPGAVGALLAVAAALLAPGALAVRTLEGLDALSPLPSAATASASNRARSRYDPFWRGVYGACSSTCGDGLRPVVGMKCMDPSPLLYDKELPDSGCTGVPYPKPEPCEGVMDCIWRLGAKPPDKCGFAEAECWSAATGEQVDKKHCRAAGSPLEPEDLYRSRHAMVDSGCAALGYALPQDICIVSVNYDKGKLLTSSVEQKEPDEILRECGGADIVVLSTQELTNRVWDHFAAYVAAASKVPGYAVAGKCGGDISAGAVLLVREHKRRFLAPVAEPCQSLPSDDGSRMNTKGSEVGVVRSVLGPIAFASTHGARGDTVAPQRVAELKEAAEVILNVEPTVVAWGGDFNPRLGGVGEDRMLRGMAVTHPKDNSTDRHPELLQEYDPRAAQRALAGYPDIYGMENQTLDALLADVTGGRIVQVPGLEHLCPTYPKTDKAGVLVDDTTRPIEGSQMTVFGRTVPGTLKYEKVWVPSFACQAAGGPVEYYYSDLNGKTKFSGSKNKAPSWPDRLLVSGGLECAPMRKMLVEDDHDTLLTKCNLTGLGAAS